MSALRYALVAVLAQVGLPATAADPPRAEVRSVRVEVVDEAKPATRLTLDARVSLGTPRRAAGVTIDARSKLAGAVCGAAGDALFANGFEG